VVVDNGSTDDSVQSLRLAFPWVTVIANGRNLGFSGGNNVGIRFALNQGAEFVWLLNNDTQVAPDCVAELLDASRRNPQFAFFASKIYYFEPPNVLWYGPGHLRLHRAMGVSNESIGVVDGPQFDREIDVSFVTGCALLLRRLAAEKVGLLDEDLFACCEDLDWCIRAKRAGLRALFVPKARLWHKVSRSFASKRGQRVQAYLCARNRFVVQKRYVGWAGVFWLLPTYLVSNAARRSMRVAMCSEGGPLIAMLHGILDGIRGAPSRISGTA
jgi:GT2 family glycosyltransferase